MGPGHGGGPNVAVPRTGPPRYPGHSHPGGGYPGGGYPGGSYRHTGWYGGSYYYGGYRGYYVPFSIGFGWGYYPFYWSPWWWGGYWGGYPGYWGGYYSYPYFGASLKVQVTPKDAEVYVDAHYAGIVDDFDGMFQSLSVEPGGHTITVFKDGFKKVAQDIYFRAGETFKLKYAMQPLQPGEPPDVRPQAPPDESAYPPLHRRSLPPPEAQPPSEPTAPPAPPAEVAVEMSNFGALAVQVQPAGAEVVIDGEVWQGPSESRRLVIQLKPGVHKIEVRKDGLEPFRTQVTIRPGETTSLNVSLSGQSGQ
jgi:hypothetical protein